MNRFQSYLQALKLAGVEEIPNSYLPNLDQTSPPPQKTDTFDLDALKKHIGNCTRCPLHHKRNNVVFGDGNPHAQLMFVGEAPGEDEDRQGLPFVGRAGQLLTKIIQAMGLDRKDVYIANVLKCRPPNNRNPEPIEIETCSPFLNQQIEIIHPKIIVCLGTFAAQTLLATDTRISLLRGAFHPWPNPEYLERYNTTIPANSIRLLPTYHPSFLLRNPAMKKPVWEDMQKVMKELGITSRS